MEKIITIEDLLKDEDYKGVYEELQSAGDEGLRYYTFVMRPGVDGATVRHVLELSAHVCVTSKQRYWDLDRIVPLADHLVMVVLKALPQNKTITKGF